MIIKKCGFLMKDLFTFRFRPALAITFKMVSGVKDENVKRRAKAGKPVATSYHLVVKGAS